MKNYTLLLFIIIALAGTFYLYHHPITQPKAEPFETLYYKTSPQGFNGMTNVPVDIISQWRVQNAQMQAELGSAYSHLKNLTEIGPFNVGGRVKAMLIDKGNPCRYLAGSTTGGLWLSENCGESWKPLDEQAPSMTISSIVQDPNDSRIIYYGTGEEANRYIGDGVYSSEDGGKTFSQLLSNSTLNTAYVRTLRHAASTPKVLFVGTDNGIVRIDRSGSNIQYKPVLSTTEGVEDIEDLGNGIVLAATEKGKVFRSTDYGNNFTQVINGLSTTASGRARIAFNAQATYALIARDSAHFEGLYKSSNQGQSFIKVSDLTSDDGFTKQYQVWYDMEIGVHPTDPNRILIGDFDIHYSNNGGTTWETVTSNHPDQHMFLTPPTGTPQDYFIIGNDGGLHKKYWNQMDECISLNNGFRVTQFYGGFYYPENANYLAIGGTQDNGTQSISNTHASQEIFGGDGAYAAVNQSNPDEVYFTYFNGFVYSQTGNQSKILLHGDRNVPDDSLFAPSLVMHPSQAGTLYYISQHRVWRTTAKGLNWQALTAQHPIGRKGYGLAISDDGNTLYAALADVLYKLPALGNPSPGSEGIITLPFSSGKIIKLRVDPADNDILYVVTATKIYKVDDINSAAPVWTEISSGLPVSMPIYDVAVDPQNPQTIFAGTYYGLYTSLNGGQSWFKDGTIPNVQCRHLEVRPTDHKLFIFTHGRGIWTADISDAALATIPYQTSFEETTDLFWESSFHDTNGKISRTSKDGGLHGNYRLLMERINTGSAAQMSQHLKLGLVNLDPAKELLLTFLYTSANNHPFTNVMYSSDGGQTFSGYHLHDLRPSVNSNTTSSAVPATINLSKMNEKYGLDLNANTVIRFQHSADAGKTAHGNISIDMVKVEEIATKYMPVPYVQNFNNTGSGLKEWLFYTLPDTQPITFSNRYGEFSFDDALIMEGQGQKDARLLLDIGNGQRNLNLEFLFLSENFTTNPGNHAGIYLRNPMIPGSEVKIYSFPQDIRNWKKASVDLSTTLSNLTQFGDDYLEIIFRGSNSTQGVIALDEVKVRENYEVAQLPYFTGFESGGLNDDLDPYWTAMFNTSGRMEIISNNEAWGQKALALHGTGNYAIQQAHLHLDLSKENAPKILFECNLFGYGQKLRSTRVLIYDATKPNSDPIEVKNLINTNLDNAFIQVDLKKEAAKYNLALSEDFVVVIEASITKSIPEEGILIDNVKVFPEGAVVPADLPYITDFSQPISQHWKLTTNTGRSEVISWSDARFGSKALALHGNIYGCNYSAPESTNDADLHLNLAGMSGVKLQFHYRNYQNDGPLAGIQSGVWISDKQGFQKIYDFPAQNQLRDWERVEIDLDSAVQARKLKYTEDFVIVFRAFSRYKMDYHYSCRDGIAIDRVVVYASEGVQTEEKYIAQEAHDGHEYDFRFRTIEDVRFSYESPYNAVGGYKGFNRNYRMGLIWSMDIPKNATILKASIQLTSRKTHTEPSFTYSMIDINAHQSSNATDFATVPYIYTSRMMTKHNVPWLLHANWIKDQRGQKQRTPDLTVLAQTLVNMSYWKSGNKMCFIIKPQYPEQPVQFDAYAYRSYADNVIDMEDLPALHIEYITEDGKVGSAIARINREEDMSTTKNTLLPDAFDFTEVSDAVMIYPNPVTDQLTVQFPPLTEEDVLQVLDMQGIALKQVAIKPGQTELDIPMQNLPSGIYLLHFKSQEKVYRIIKR